MKRSIALGFVFGLLAAACAGTRPGAGPTPSPSPIPTAPPSPKPSFSARPTPSTPTISPSPERSRAYRVQLGDTLFSIGRLFRVPWQDIAALNGIPAPYVLIPGQVIHIPQPGEQVPPLPTPTGSAGLPASLVGAEWYRLPTSRKVVALTFDAGGDNGGVASILSTLESKGVTATFFVVGRWAEIYPTEARQVAAHYSLGNHTYSHPDLTTLSDAAIRSEVARGEDALIDVTGQNPKPLFRFPFGASTDHAIDVVNSVGYGCINWTVASRGWMGTSKGISADEIVDSVVEGLEPGAIILMHVGANPDDHSTLDAQALPRMIDAIRARGYSFVTIEQYV